MASGVRVDLTELTEIQNALRKISKKFGKRKVKQILRRAARPLRKQMRTLAPVNKEKKYPSKDKKFTRKYTWYDGTRITYKKGTLKRSVMTFAGKSGIFVAPRWGGAVKQKNEIGEKVSNPYKDGWYAHLAIEPHKTRGGGFTSDHQSEHFIEKARLSKKDEVLRIIMMEAQKLIKW
jgi:hypothetical protein